MSSAKLHILTLDSSVGRKNILKYVERCVEFYLFFEN